MTEGSSLEGFIRPVFTSRICQATHGSTWVVALALQLNLFLSCRYFGDAFQVNLWPLAPSFLALPKLESRWNSYGKNAVRRKLEGVAYKQSSRTFSPLSMARMNSNDLDDPYEILGIPLGEMDKSVIKRAYRRMAMKYHPDVAAKDNSDPEARKRANERFIKINAAYELLSGKTGAQNSAGKGTTGSSSTYSQSPPHRRATSQSRTSNRDYMSEDWRDFFPNDFAERYRVREDDKYDTGGDSYSKIFSDLFEGIASGANSAVGSSGGILNDIIEFLEGNYADAGGFGVSSSKRADEEMLREILSSNNVDLIREEIDDTSLLIQQLETKLKNVESEIAGLQMDIQSPNVRFFEREMKEEEIAALKARRDVVEDYLKRGRKRLVKLQMRYKEMRGGVGSGGTASTRAGSRSSSHGSNTSGTRSSYGTSTSSGGRSEAGASSSANETSRTSAASRESFSSVGRGRGSARPSGVGVSSRANESSSGTSTSSRESFGSFGRGRGSGSGRARARTTADSDTTSTRSTRTTTEASSYERSSTRQNQSSSSSTTASSSVNSMLPPHRRPTTTSWKERRQEKQRLQEIKVDEEFDKLKREMGL